MRYILSSIQLLFTLLDIYKVAEGGDTSKCDISKWQRVHQLKTSKYRRVVLIYIKMCKINASLDIPVAKINQYSSISLLINATD